MLQSLVISQLYKMNYIKITQNDLIQEAEDIAEMIKKPSLIADTNAIMTFLETIQFSMRKSGSVLWIVSGNGEITSVSGQEDSTTEEERRLSMMEMQEYLDPVFEGKQVVWKNEFQSRFTKPRLSIAHPGENRRPGRFGRVYPYGAFLS